MGDAVLYLRQDSADRLAATPTRPPKCCKVGYLKGPYQRTRFGSEAISKISLRMKPASPAAIEAVTRTLIESIERENEADLGMTR